MFPERTIRHDSTFKCIAVVTELHTHARYFWRKSTTWRLIIDKLAEPLEAAGLSHVAVVRLLVSRFARQKYYTMGAASTPRWSTHCWSFFATTLRINIHPPLQTRDKTSDETVGFCKKTGFEKEESGEINQHASSLYTIVWRLRFYVLKTIHDDL